MTNKLSLIIVHYGEVAITNRCIESISNTFLTVLNVIVVNNDSNRKLRFINDNKILVLNAPQNNGYASACNFGIRMARENGCEHFIICNNDIEFTDQFFTEFIPRVLSLKIPAIVAPKINYLQNKTNVWFAGGKINKFKMEGIHIIQSSSENELIETEFISGCCFYLSDKTYDIIGPLDEKFFLYEEDLDYSIRAIKKNVKLLVDLSTTVYHSVSTSTNDNHKIGKYYSGIYPYKLRSKILILHRYSSFPFSIFNWLFIVYKLFKYTLVLFLRGDFIYITKLLKEVIKTHY